MKQYCVEYKSPIGRIKSIRVEARNFDEACEAVVEAVGCNFADIQSVEERGA